MIIPINREHIELIPLKEQEPSGNHILMEAMHAFDEQYTWARKTAEVVYKCLVKGQKKAKVTFKNNTVKSIHGAIVTIENNNLMKTSANILGFNDSFYCLLNIYTNKNILQKKDKDAINEIWNAIVHELGHANIFLNQYVNDGKFGEAPDDYEIWLRIISDSSVSPSDNLYLYCYALYSTYYQEIQAFVSQTYSDTVKELNNLYGGIENITKEQLWTALKNTNTYQVYKANISTANSLIQSRDIIENLSKRLRDYGLFYTKEKILKDLKYIKKKSEAALHDAYNNVYYYLGSKMKNPR